MLLSPFFTLPLRQSFLSSFLPFFLYLIHPALPSYLSFAPSNLPARSPPPPPPPLRIGAEEWWKESQPRNRLSRYIKLQWIPPPLPSSLPIQFIDVLGKNIQSLYLWNIHPIAMIGLYRDCISILTKYKRYYVIDSFVPSSRLRCTISIRKSFVIRRHAYVDPINR